MTDARTKKSCARDVIRLAKHSRYDQVVWRDRAGTRHRERVSPVSVKAAMLACGTGGRFTVYSARSAISSSMTWRCGVTVLVQLRRGWYSHG